MSWLSTSLSENLTNITGQISTFTKDMLTEGPVEADGHDTELKNAKSRLRELELTLYTQREEYDRVKELNHELQERAEATELQISSISREYRTLLQDKENDFQQLRDQLELFKEQSTQQEDRDRLPSFSEDSFVDGSSHEDQVEYLKVMISKLQEEKKSWTKNNEKENLHKELDHYQHELATLHSSYSQRIALLNKKHKEEIEHLEKYQQEDSLRIEELEQQLVEWQPENDENAEEISALKEALENSQQEMKRLNQELDLLQKRPAMEEEHVTKSSNQVVEFLIDSASDFELIDEETVDNETTMSVNQELSSENHISELKALIDELQQEKQDLMHQRDQAIVSEGKTSASLESLKEELSNLGIITMELMKEVEQSQGVDKEKSIEIESLKKICQFKGDGSNDEVIKLRDTLAALWKKYAAVVFENEKVRLEVYNLKQRLLTQLKDRHCDTKGFIDGIGDARTRLEGRLEGHREEVHLEKQQLVALIPEVENDVEEQEESVSRLLERNERNNKETKEIVNDIGKVWATNNLVASLQAEKAVLERTIVGLEEKVEELEHLLDSHDDEYSTRSSVSTVISVDTSSRAAPDLVEPGENYVMALQPGERSSSASEDEVICAEATGEDIKRLLERSKEYEETIQEFELIKEDWEGEKEALENVVVDLRKRLKETTAVENDSHLKIESGGGLQNTRCFDEIQELLIKKNYLNDEDVLELTNEETRTELVLVRTLEYLMQDKDVEPMIIKKHQNEESFSALGASPDESREQVLGFSDIDRNDVEFSVNLSENRSTTENDRSTTENDRSTTENDRSTEENDRSTEENDRSTTENDRSTEENDRSTTENELEKTKNELNQAMEERSELESKLKFLERELEESNRNVNSVLSEKDGEVHKLKKMMEQLEGALSNFQNDKDRELTELHEENSRVQKELHEAMSSYKTLLASAEEKKVELISIIEEKSSLQNEMVELNFEKEKLVSMVNERDERIEELQDMCDSVDERASFLQEEGKERTKAFSELSEECSLIKEEKDNLFNLLQEKDTKLSNSLIGNEKLSELLYQQELASEEIKEQNTKLAEDLEKWRIQMEELNQVKETLSRDVDKKMEEILTLKENNIELVNQSYEYSQQNNEVSQKLSMLEQLVAENSSLQSENLALVESLSQKQVSEKELKDSMNLLLQEKRQLEMSFFQKSIEIEKEVQRKIDEIEVLRLEVSRLMKAAQQKDKMIRAQVSSNLFSGEDVAVKQEHIRRILEEKDVEISALRTKNESLLTIFAENEENSTKVREQHEQRIRAMLEQQERMLGEINEKSEQLVAIEDKMEMMKMKAASKDQASALIHAEHQKLIHLNKSQSDEIGKLRERVSSLGIRVAEKDHGIGNEVHKHNADLQLQVDALQGEQERLLTLVHEKDRQLSEFVKETLVKKSKQDVVDALPSPSYHENDKKSAEENKKLTEEVVLLEDRVTSLNDLIENEKNTSRTLEDEKDVMGQRLRSLEQDKGNANEQVLRLQHQLKNLQQDLSAKERDIMTIRDEKAREMNSKTYEINTLRNEKEELLLEQNSCVEELQRKLSTLLHVISSDEGFKDEQFEILEDREDFQRLLSKVKSHRARLLSDKDSELRLLKEQVTTLSSVQNISSPELQSKLESFMKEKDEMSQRLLEMENEKLEFLEEKENELASLQTHVLNLSSVLKQKEREWLLEQENLNQENIILDKRTKTIQEKHDSLLELKTQMESEVARLVEEVAMLGNSANQKNDIIVNEKERRVRELETELESLKQRYARSLQEAQNLKASLEEAEKVAKEFETKKEKELERLRRHLLQVEDSYTREALASEEREKELRNQRDVIQEQLLTSSHSLQDTNRTASMKMENLQEQLMSMTAHRDEVLAQLEQAQEQSLQHLRSVENLQMVLEQFQREKATELKTLHENNLEQQNEIQNEVSRLRDREVELQRLLENASNVLNKADRLGEDLKSKEDELESLKTAVVNLENYLQSSHDKIRMLTSNNDVKIEKSLMKNMLIAYFSTAEQKRSDVVAVLGHILNFSEDEIKKVGSGSQPPQSSGWFSGLLSYGGTNESRQHDKTFSELFVSFLEKESESEIGSSSVLQPSPPATHTRIVRTTAAPTSVPRGPQDRPQLPINPLATSSPYGNTGAMNNALLNNIRVQESPVVKESSGYEIKPSESNPLLLGSTQRQTIDLPTITSSSSSSALRKILFDN